MDCGDEERAALTEHSEHSSLPANPWIQVISKRSQCNASKQLKTDQKAPPTQASRLPTPRIPADQFVAVIRPTGNVCVKNWATSEITNSLLTTNGFGRAEFIRQVTIINQDTTNLVVIGSKNIDLIDRISRITDLTILSTTYQVRAYMKPPPGTSRGVINGVSEEIDLPTLHELLAPNEPYLVHARFMGQTRSVILTFDGYRVPYYVKLGCELVRCHPYRRMTQVCTNCGDTGHRRDVCPSPPQTICGQCATVDPSATHHCVPKCKLCDGPHPTANKDCPQRSRPPIRPPTRTSDQTSTKYSPNSTLPLDKDNFPALPKTNQPTPHHQVSWSAVLASSSTAPPFPPP